MLKAELLRETKRACLFTVKAPSAVLVVSLLGEAVVSQQLVGWMPELGQRLGSAAVASRQRSAF